MDIRGTMMEWWREERSRIIGKLLLYFDDVSARKENQNDCISLHIHRNLSFSGAVSTVAKSVEENAGLI